MDERTWLAERKRGIGSSTAAMVCGVSRFGTPLRAYLGYVSDEPVYATESMRWGLALEPVIARQYAEETGRSLVKPPALLRHPEIEWMIASLDYRTQEDGRIVEVKTSRFADGWGEPGTDSIPEDYLLQVQHQMHVADADRADVAVLIGGSDFRIYEVARNRGLAESLVSIEADFWQRVKDRRPPEPDFEHPETPALIEKLHRPVDGLRVTLDAEADDLVSEYQRLAKLECESEKAKKATKARLVSLLGSASLGLLPSGRFLTRRMVRRSGYAVEAGEYATLAIKEPK